MCGNSVHRGRRGDASGEPDYHRGEFGHDLLPEDAIVLAAKARFARLKRRRSSEVPEEFA